MKAQILAVAVCTPLLLTACSSAEPDEATPTPQTTTQQTDWAHPDERIETFVEYICQRDGHESDILPETQAVAAAVGVLADETATPEDKKIAMEISLYQGGSTGIDTVPMTLTPRGPGTCEGWVWEKHLEQIYDDEYSDFTFDMAIELGVI